MVANRPSAASHEERVAAVASQVFALAARRAPAHIDKGGVHHFVPLPGDRRFRGARVDASPLRHVLDVDPDRRLCTCEPGVSFRALVEATLAHGLLPTVVPELEGITVGGAVAGCSVESMSFRHGGFHDSCLEYEVVTGTGEILVCSPEREPLAFHMLHGSYGTLGILTRATFRLVPARPFVRLEYRHLRTAEAFRGEALASTRDAEIDFLDGIVHGPNHFVLCVGRFVDDAPMRSDYRGEEIFYRGFATTAWARGIGPTAAIVRGGLFFALAHVLTIGGADFGHAAQAALVAFIARIPVGLALGWIFLRRGSLTAAIALHATFNAALVLIAAGAAA